MSQVEECLGEVPLCLVGHSLGGRAAILAAGADRVLGAAALAPWVYPGDVPGGIEGKRFLIVHGDRDRIASPQRAAALADRLRAYADVEFVLAEGARHAMLRRHEEFSGRAARFATEVLRVPR
jgi:dienelactone hydrolase